MIISTKNYNTQEKCSVGDLTDKWRLLILGPMLGGGWGARSPSDHCRAIIDQGMQSSNAKIGPNLSACRSPYGAGIGCRTLPMTLQRKSDLKIDGWKLQYIRKLLFLTVILSLGPPYKTVVPHQPFYSEQNTFLPLSRQGGWYSEITYSCLKTAVNLKFSFNISFSISLWFLVTPLLW